MPFQQHFIYPLKDAERYDDDFGEGFDHALLADYGPISPGCLIHDAWIVTAAGDVHPGFNVSPVPIRLEDVDEAKGRLFEAAHV